MKRLLLFLTVFCSFLGFAQLETATSSDYGIDLTIDRERIINFHSVIDVQKDASIFVTELIKVHSEGNDIKRGIFRSLPTSRNLNGSSHKVKYDIVSVKKNGAKEDYHTESEGGFLKIYIGQKEVILSPGEYEYEIKYSAKNQIGFFDQYDELYWNVNGAEWGFDIENISAKVNLPQGANILQNACYTGAIGGKESNCSGKVVGDQSIEWTGNPLAAHENLTIAVGFTKGVILQPPPPTFLEKYGIAIFLALVMLGLFVTGYNTWRKYGVDPVKPTVYPQFNVPDNMSPAALGYLKFESFKDSYLTASLVNLAIKGFIQIVEEESSSFFGMSKSKTFKVNKLKEPDQSLPKEEIAVMNNLFQNRDVVNFDSQYDSKVEHTVDDYKANLLYQFKDFLTAGNNSKLVIAPALIVFGVFIASFIFSNWINDTMTFAGFGMFGLAFIAIFGVIVYAVLNNVKNAGCLIAAILIFFFPFIGGIILFMFVADLDFNSKACIGFLGIGIIYLIIFKILIKRPSEEKLRIQSLIDGFKMYMGAAENEQLKFHNSPKMTPEIFEKYLPYAMVLGVDDIWGKKFEAALAAMAIGYTSSWYMGSMLNMNSFGSALNSSLTNSISSGSTAPSSSGSSSSSGSGGGGFSGGGGGGGGGGGW